MSILDTIAEKTRQRVAEEKLRDPELPNRVLAQLAERNTSGQVQPFPFEAALRSDGLSFICEVKRASPSKGLIAPEFPYTQIAEEYEEAGADAISVLTEPYWFMGSLEYLKEIRAKVSIPILRKDFTVDPYMIYQAKEAGANAVLLICSILGRDELTEYMALAEKLGLSAVVEAHDVGEIEMAVSCGARIIGVNNRNLGDFSVDMENSGRLRELVPEGTIFISESGVKGRGDTFAAEKMRADAVLVGEALMRADDKKRKLSELRGRVLEESNICSINRIVRAAGDGRFAVKVCGLKTEEEIDWANELRPDLVGFVFANTRRKISDGQARLLRDRLDVEIPAVGVFVNEDENRIVELLQKGIIDIAQLHGDEDDAEIIRIHARTGKPVIKAIVIKTEQDRDKWRLFPHADLLLLDAGRGSGETFDWSMAGQVDRPFLLAGGLNEANVNPAISQMTGADYGKCGFIGLDVSSGLENPGGGKNYEKMRHFIGKVRGKE